MSEKLAQDENSRHGAGGVTNDSAKLLKNFRVDPTTFRLLVESIMKDAVSGNTITIDATGALKVTGGAASVSAEFMSPFDFNAVFTTSGTLTLTGVPFTIVGGQQIVYVKQRNTVTNITTIYVNGANGIGIGHSAGVLTIYSNGIVVTTLTSNDIYEVGVNSQRKSYDPTLDITKVINQAPDSAKYVQDTLASWSSTTVGIATIYYPSVTGLSMDGFKDFDLGITAADITGVTVSIEVSNDPAAVTGSFKAIYFYDRVTNTWINTLTGTSLSAQAVLENLNVMWVRVKVVTQNGTNSGTLYLRRKAL